MAWRYRKRIKVAPGVYVNLSKSGVSTTIGKRGASVNIGKNGTYLNTGIPGTGLYNRQKIGGSSSSSHSSSYSNSSQNSNSTLGCIGFMALWAVILMIIYLIYHTITVPMYIIGFIIAVVIALLCIALFSSKDSSTKDLHSNTEIDTHISQMESSPDTPKEIKFIPYNDLDPLFEEAAKLVVNTQNGSTSMIQRQFSIGYNRAGLIMNQLENKGIVGSAQGAKPRNVIVRSLDDLNKLLTDIKQNSRHKTDNISVSKQVITKNQYELIKTESSKLHQFMRAVTKRQDVRESIDKFLDIHNNDGTLWSIEEKVRFVILGDVYRCYCEMGHDVNTDDLENLGILIYFGQYVSPEADISYGKIDEFIKKVKPSILDIMEFVKPICSVPNLPKNEFVLQNILFDIDNDLRTQYTTLLYRFMSATAKADGKISLSEAKYLADIMAVVKSESCKQEDNVKITKQQGEETKNAIDELNALIGLDSVKEEINKLTNFIKIQQLREQKGMKTSSVSYHCVFTGNPGTGKTTVARIVAAIYKELGILKKGQLIETDRSGLVAEYIGQTAVKTNKIIDSALDGVLFVDEAYSLVQGGGNDYGNEAISTLLKRMEDDRDRLVVILAGYGNEMKMFIDSNPGLQSRFNRYIDFKDYSAEELMKIFELNLKKNEYRIVDSAKVKLQEYIDNAVACKDVNFGNGRFVRNLFEKVLENQAMRLSSVPNITEKDLVEITIDDIHFN